MSTELQRNIFLQILYFDLITMYNANYLYTFVQDLSVIIWNTCMFGFVCFAAFFIILSP